MEINKIQLELLHKGGLNSSSCDGMRHVKTLPYLSVVQAVEGSYDIQLGKDGVHNTGSSGFFIAPANVQQTILHNADEKSKNMVCRWVFLKIKVNDLYALEDLYDFPVILSESHKEEMHACFNRLFAADDVFEEYVCYYEIVKILSQISHKKKHQIPPYLEHALTYMKAHFRDKITVKEIAEHVNLSESYLYSVFKKEMGVSPITYLNHYRLSLAADELIKTDKTITEIADMVGIDDSVYFNKIFRKAYQMPPSNYRQIYRNSRE